MRTSHHPRGYLLLEVMIAVTIFLIAVIGITYSLNSIMDTVAEIRQDRRISLQLESFMRVMRTERLKQGDGQRLDSTGDGTVYTADIQPVTDLQTYKGETINGIWKVHIQAVYKDTHQEERLKTYDILIYQP